MDSLFNISISITGEVFLEFWEWVEENYGLLKETTSSVITVMSQAGLGTAVWIGNWIIWPNPSVNIFVIFNLLIPVFPYVNLEKQCIITQQCQLVNFLTACVRTRIMFLSPPYKDRRKSFILWEHRDTEFLRLHGKPVY